MFWISSFSNFILGLFTLKLKLFKEFEAICKSKSNSPSNPKSGSSMILASSFSKFLSSFIFVFIFVKSAFLSKST